MINSENLELGEGNLTLKLEGDEAAKDVGACEDMSITLTSKTLDISCGQSLLPIDSFIIGEDIKLKVNLKEDTIRNFVLCTGGDPADIYDGETSEIYKLPGGSIRRMPFMEVVYKVPRVKDKTKFVTYTFYKCKADGKLTYAFKKDKERVFTLELTAYPDSTNSDSPGKVVKDKFDAEIEKN